MPRVPKDPDQRARRNRAATAAELPEPGSDQLRTIKAPPLNADLLGIKGRIKAPVQRWWKVIWQSPMAPRWLDADVEGLYGIALLRHQAIDYAQQGKSVATLLSEIRQQEARFGLDVLARRRLDWRIAGPRLQEQAPLEEPEETPAPPEPQGFDPRQVLRAVK